MDATSRTPRDPGQRPARHDAGVTSADRWRTGALLSANVAQIAAPALLARLGGREIAELSGENPSVITPPGYAFAVWGPIYLATTTASVMSVRAAATDEQRRHGWWLVGAYGALVAWAQVTQNGRYAAGPPVLALAASLTGTAHAQLQQPAESPAGRASSISTGMLLGWSGVATLVNASSAATSLGVDPDAPAVVRGSAGLLAAGAIAATAAVASSRRGALPLASTIGWALVTIAASPRPALVRGVSASGLVAVVGGAVASVLRGRAA